MKKAILLLAALLILSACGSQPPPTAAAPSSSPAASSSSAPEPPSEEPEPEGPVGIKGSHITDILLGLEGSVFEIPNPGFKRSADQSVSAHYADTIFYHEGVGLTFDYSLSAASDFSLITGSFGISNTDFLISEDDFLTIAGNYLGFCATMPCDATSGSLDGIARDWVQHTIGDISGQKSGVGIVWGDARFSLDWSEAPDGDVISVWMTIKQADLPAPDSEPSEEDSAKYADALKRLEEAAAAASK